MLNGFLSTASSTIDSNLRITGNVFFAGIDCSGDPNGGYLTSSGLNGTGVECGGGTLVSDLADLGDVNDSINPVLNHLLYHDGTDWKTILASSFCATITGSATLCDGSDDGGAGASAYEIATSTSLNISDVAYFSKTSGRTTLAGVATSSLAQSTGINIANGTSAYVIGSQPTFTIDQSFSPTWTGAHVFNNITRSTTTAATSTNLYGANLTANVLSVGQTASTTINSSGDLLVSGSTTLQRFTGTNSTTTNATTTAFYSDKVKIGSGTPLISFDGTNGSSTLQKFTFTTATGTAATTTNFYATTASTTNLSIGGGTLTIFGTSGTSLSSFCTAITGAAGLCDGSDDGSGGGGADFTYSTDIGFGVTGSATTTKTKFTAGIHASSTSQFDNATSTLFTATTAWLTNLFIGADTIAEYISDTAGAMWTGNTETGGAITYDDADNTLDFVCNTASGSVFGCLSTTDWSTFNGKESVLSFTWPLVRTTNTITWGGISTSSAQTIGGMPYWTSTTGALGNVATSSLTAGTGISTSATLGALVGGSAATLTVDQTFSPTWTGNHIFNSITRSTSTNATTTGGLFGGNITGNILAIGGTASTTINSSGDLLVSGSTTLQRFTATNSTTTNATTTNFYSTTASTTNFSIGGGTLTIFGTSGTSLPAFCTAITGGAGLCDGSDDGGAGTSAYEIATTTDIAVSQVAYINKTSGRTTLASVATSSLVQSTGINIANGTTAYVLGAQPTFTIDQSFTPTWTGAHIFNSITRSTSTNASTTNSLFGSKFTANELRVGGSATTSIDSAGNVTLPAAGTLTVPALTSALLLTDGNGLFAEYAGTSCTNQFVRSLSVLGAATCATVGTADVAGLDISDDTNLAATWPIILTGDTLSFGGLSTSSPIAAGAAGLYSTGVNTVASVATSTPTISTGLTYSGTFGNVFGGASGNLTVDQTFSPTWTGAHIFNNITRSTSTQATSTNFFTQKLLANIASFGQTATSTFNSDGGLTGLGVFDLGGASSFELPNGTGPTVDAAGETAVDTTSDQFIYFGASTKRVLQPFQNLGFAYATSTTWTGTSTLRIGPSPAAITVDHAYCETDTGTVGVSLYDGTNRANYIVTASTTINKFAYSSNNTFTAGETIRVDVGTPASTPTTLSCRFMYTYTAD